MSCDNIETINFLSSDRVSQKGRFHSSPPLILLLIGPNINVVNERAAAAFADDTDFNLVNSSIH